MSELHRYGLVRFSKKSGKIDTSMTALGNALLQLWALQNTTKTKASLILDLDSRLPFAEFIGDPSGFPKVCKVPSEMSFDFPEELFDTLSAAENRH